MRMSRNQNLHEDWSVRKWEMSGFAWVFYNLKALGCLEVQDGLGKNSNWNGFLMENQWIITFF